MKIGDKVRYKKDSPDKGHSRLGQDFVYTIQDEEDGDFYLLPINNEYGIGGVNCRNSTWRAPEENLELVEKHLASISKPFWKQCEAIDTRIFYEISAGSSLGVDLTIKDKTNYMSKITNYIKDLALTADEKLLRKHGLKTECGEYTNEAKDLIINKLCQEKESYLLDIVNGLEKEEKKNIK